MVSALDDDNYKRSYSFDDPALKNTKYTAIAPLSKVYIIESCYTIESLQEWDSRHARLDRQYNRKKTEHALPHHNIGE